MRENILEDDKTIVYVYDIGGNIVSKTEYTNILGEITGFITAVNRKHEIVLPVDVFFKLLSYNSYPNFVEL